MSDESVPAAVVSEAPAAAPKEHFAPEPGSDEAIVQELKAEYEARQAEEAKSIAPSEKKKGAKTDPPTKDKPVVEGVAVPDAAKFTQAQKLLEEGKAEDAVALLFGKSKNFFKVNNAKWAEFRQKEEGLRESTRQFNDAVQKAEAQATKLIKDHKPILDARNAFREGNYEQFATLIEEITGVAYDEAQRAVLRGTAALDPELKKTRAEIKKLREEREEEKRQQAEMARKAREEYEANNAKATQAQAQQQAFQWVEQSLAGHKVTSIENYQSLVLAKILATHNVEDGTFSLSPEDAAEQVFNEEYEVFQKKASVFGANTTTAAPPDRKRAAPKPPPKGRGGAAKTSNVNWDEMSEDEIIAELKREHANGLL